MQFQTPLVQARLIRRYKRFLADVRLADGREVTAHCANPGAMTGLAEPGTTVWVEPNDDPNKKLNYAWRLVELEGGQFAGIDTALPNRLVRQALLARSLPDFAAYTGVRPEYPCGDKSRIDFLLTADGLPDLFLEVKSVTLCRTPRLGEFPDTVTARGARHLRVLSDFATLGHRAALLYVIQRTDCTRVRLASDIDPSYAQAAQEARAAGVSFHAVRTLLSPTAVELGASAEVL